MNIYVSIIFAFIILAGVSFFYKIYLQCKLKDPNRRASIFSVMFRFYTLLDFLPLRRKSNNIEENELRSRANVSLMVFYASIVLGLIIAALAR